MENRRGYSGLLTVLGALLLGARAQQQQGRLVGSDVTLMPRYTEDLKEIIWWINNSIAVEMELDPLAEHTFMLPRDRVTIDNTIGALTIRNLTVGNSGFYTAEVVLRNNTVDKTDITLTVRVPLAINKTVGEDITLVPQYTGDPSEIKWTVNGKKLVERRLKPLGGPTFHHLQDRATISPNDGSLTIRHLTIEDSGVYKAEVTENNGIQETGIKVTVLKSSRPSGWIIALIVILVLAVIAVILWYCCYKKKCCREKSSTQPEMTIYKPKGSDIEREEESERCITVKFWNDVISQIDESRRLLEDHSKRIQSPCLTIHWVQPADHGIFTAEAVMSNGKKCTFTEGTEIAVGIEFEDGKTIYKPATENVIELVWKKDGVTMFEYAVSSLKVHASNIKLEPGSVTVNNAEGKESYKVKFQLEEPPESTSIGSITFHPIKMTGKNQITWKKDSQRVNIGGNRIKCDPNGDLTIYNATSEDKGKYTVQCIDKKLDQEFILHL